MELALGLIVLVGVGYLLFVRNSKPASKTTSQPEAPYKVEAPAVAEVTTPEPVKEKPAKAKKPAAKKAKPATEKAPKAPAKKTPKLKRSK